MPNLKEEPSTSTDTKRKRRTNNVSGKQKTKELNIASSLALVKTSLVKTLPLKSNTRTTTKTVGLPSVRSQRQQQKQNIGKLNSVDSQKQQTLANSLQLANYSQLLANHNTVIKVRNYTGIFKQQVTNTKTSLTRTISSTTQSFNNCNSTVANAFNISSLSNSTSANIRGSSNPTRTMNMDVHMKVLRFGNAQITNNMQNMQKQQIQNMLATKCSELRYAQPKTIAAASSPTVTSLPSSSSSPISDCKMPALISAASAAEMEPIEIEDSPSKNLPITPGKNIIKAVESRSLLSPPQLQELPGISKKQTQITPKIKNPKRLQLLKSKPKTKSKLNEIAVEEVKENNIMPPSSYNKNVEDDDVVEVNCSSNDSWNMETPKRNLISRKKKLSRFTQTEENNNFLECNENFANGSNSNKFPIPTKFSDVSNNSIGIPESLNFLNATQYERLTNIFGIYKITDLVHLTLWQLHKLGLNQSDKIKLMNLIEKIIVEQNDCVKVALINRKDESVEEKSKQQEKPEFELNENISETLSPNQTIVEQKSLNNLKCNLMNNLNATHEDVVPTILSPPASTVNYPVENSQQIYINLDDYEDEDDNDDDDDGDQHLVIDEQAQQNDSSTIENTPPKSPPHLVLIQSEPLQVQALDASNDATKEKSDQNDSNAIPTLQDIINKKVDKMAIEEEIKQLNMPPTPAVHAIAEDIENNEAPLEARNTVTQIDAEIVTPSIVSASSEDTLSASEDALTASQGALTAASTETVTVPLLNDNQTDLQQKYIIIGADLNDDTTALASNSQNFIILNAEQEKDPIAYADDQADLEMQDVELSPEKCNFKQYNSAASDASFITRDEELPASQDECIENIQNEVQNMMKNSAVNDNNSDGDEDGIDNDIEMLIVEKDILEPTIILESSDNSLLELHLNPLEQDDYNSEEAVESLQSSIAMDKDHDDDDDEGKSPTAELSICDERQQRNEQQELAAPSSKQDEQQIIETTALPASKKKIRKAHVKRTRTLRSNSQVPDEDEDEQNSTTIEQTISESSRITNNPNEESVCEVTTTIKTKALLKTRRLKLPKPAVTAATEQRPVDCEIDANIINKLIKKEANEEHNKLAEDAMPSTTQNIIKTNRYLKKTNLRTSNAAAKHQNYEENKNNNAAIKIKQEIPDDYPYTCKKTALKSKNKFNLGNPHVMLAKLKKTKDASSARTVSFSSQADSTTTTATTNSPNSSANSSGTAKAQKRRSSSTDCDIERTRKKDKLPCDGEVQEKNNEQIQSETLLAHNEQRNEENHTQTHRQQHNATKLEHNNDECDLRQQIENKKRNKSILKQHRTISMATSASGSNNALQQQQQRKSKHQQEEMDEDNSSENEMLQQQQKTATLKKNQLIKQQSTVTESDTDDAFQIDEESANEEEEIEDEDDEVNDDEEDKTKNYKKPKFISSNQTKRSNKYSNVVTISSTEEDDVDDNELNNINNKAARNNSDFYKQSVLPSFKDLSESLSSSSSSSHKARRHINFDNSAINIRTIESPTPSSGSIKSPSPIKEFYSTIPNNIEWKVYEIFIDKLEVNKPNSIDKLIKTNSLDPRIFRYPKQKTTSFVENSSTALALYQDPRNNQRLATMRQQQQFQLQQMQQPQQQYLIPSSTDLALLPISTTQSMLASYLQRSQWYQSLHSSSKVQVNATLSQLMRALNNFQTERSLNPMVQFDIFKLDCAIELIDIMHNLGVNIDANGLISEQRNLPIFGAAGAARYGSGTTSPVNATYSFIQQVLAPNAQCTAMATSSSRAMATAAPQPVIMMNEPASAAAPFISCYVAPSYMAKPQQQHIHLQEPQQQCVAVDCHQCKQQQQPVQQQQHQHHHHQHQPQHSCCASSSAPAAAPAPQPASLEPSSSMNSNSSADSYANENNNRRYNNNNNQFRKPFHQRYNNNNNDNFRNSNSSGGGGGGGGGGSSSPPSSSSSYQDNPRFNRRPFNKSFNNRNNDNNDNYKNNYKNNNNNNNNNNSYGKRNTIKYDNDVYNTEYNDRDAVNSSPKSTGNPFATSTPNAATRPPSPAPYSAADGGNDIAKSPIRNSPQRTSPIKVQPSKTNDEECWDSDN